MVKKFKTKEVPSASSPLEAAPLLNRMLTQGLPVFVIRAAGATYSEVFGPYLGAFEDAGVLPNYNDQILLRYERPPLEFRVLKAKAQRSPISPSGARYRDIALHMDSSPDKRADVVSSLGMNLVQVGAVEATFFEPTPEFALDETRDINIGQHGSMHELFESGRVDDEILTPIAYSARLRRLDLVVFRIAGRLPAVHHFKTIKYPRMSAACTAAKIETGGNRS